jgi:single-strand DNA-binding protein
MSGSVNKVILVGNVGQAPDIRSTQNGKEIANLTIATSESWKDKQTGENIQKTEWHKVSVFNEALVGLIKRYVVKGSKLYIEGQLQTRKWQDKDGQDRYTTEVVLQGYNGSITMLNKVDGGAPRQEAPTDNTPEDLDDEIPF